jgi:hypothetical protein
VVPEHKGVPLPARAFEKDARMRQRAIVDNKVLAAALIDIQRQQRARELRIMATKRMIKALALARLAAERAPRWTDFSKRCCRERHDPFGIVSKYSIPIAVRFTRATPTDIVPTARLRRATPRHFSEAQPHAGATKRNLDGLATQFI